MEQKLEQAFEQVANQFAVPDSARLGEWLCRLCGGQTEPNGPMIHVSDCKLSVLYGALEEDD